MEGKNGYGYNNKKEKKEKKSNGMDGWNSFSANGEEGKGRKETKEEDDDPKRRGKRRGGGREWMDARRLSERYKVVSLSLSRHHFLFVFSQCYLHFPRSRKPSHTITMVN